MDDISLTANEMEIISLVLEAASKYGLQIEVIWSAFEHKSQFPDASLEECFTVGLSEWDL